MGGGGSFEQKKPPTKRLTITRRKKKKGTVSVKLKGRKVEVQKKKKGGQEPQFTGKTEARFCQDKGKTQRTRTGICLPTGRGR